MSYRSYSGNYGSLGGYSSSASTYGSLGRSGRGYGTLSDAGSTRSYSSSRNYGGSFSNLAGQGTSGFQSSPWKSSSYSAGINKGGGRSGYISDYGGSAISTRSDRFRSTREKSPIRSFRSSRTDRDTTFRSSSATLTPFETRRSRTSDSNLTPFTSRLNRSRSYEPTYQRKSVSHSVSSLAAKFERQDPEPRKSTISSDRFSRRYGRQEPKESTISSDRFSKKYSRQEPKESSISSDRFSKRYARDEPKERSISTDRFSRKYSRQEPKESSISSDRFSKRYTKDEPKDRYSSKYSDRHSLASTRFSSDRHSLTSFASSSRRDKETLAVPSYSRQASRESRTSQEDVPITAKAIRERRHAREREREKQAEAESEIPQPPVDVIERRSMRAQKAYKESGESLGARERRISREILQKSKEPKDNSSSKLREQNLPKTEPTNEKMPSLRERRLAREKQAIPVIDVRSSEIVDPVSNQSLSSARERRLANEKQDSSDSVSEQELLDADIRFLTSRGTNTGDIESDPIWYSRKTKKKSISRTKTKRYPKSGYKRVSDRPLLIDCACQVNQEELRQFRRMLKYGSMSSLFLSQSEATVPRSPFKKESQVTNLLSKYEKAKEDHLAAEKAYAQKISPAHAKMSYRDWQNLQNSEALAIQSAFAPKTRSTRQEDILGGIEDEEIESVSMVGRPIRYVEDIVVPNSGFIPLEIKKRDEKWKAEKARLAEYEKKHAARVAALTPENLSLKDSIDKVRSWKKQLQVSPPETPDTPGDVFVSLNELQSEVSDSETKRKARGHKRTGSDSSKAKRTTRTSSSEDGRNKNRRRSRSRPRRDSHSSKKSVDYEEDEIKDFRKSELNKGDPNTERNAEVLAYRKKHRRKSSAGSSSDAFSKDQSPDRLQKITRKESFEKQLSQEDTEKQEPQEDEWIKQVKEKYTIKRKQSSDTKRESRPTSAEKKERKKLQRQRSQERRLAEQMLTSPTSRRTSLEEERMDSNRMPHFSMMEQAFETDEDEYIEQLDIPDKQKSKKVAKQFRDKEQSSSNRVPTLSKVEQEYEIEEEDVEQLDIIDENAKVKPKKKKVPTATLR